VAGKNDIKLISMASVSKGVPFVPVIKKKKKEIKKKKPPGDFSREEILVKPDTKSTALYPSRRFNQGRDGVAEPIQHNTEELGD